MLDSILVRIPVKFCEALPTRLNKPLRSQEWMESHSDSTVVSRQPTESRATPDRPFGLEEDCSCVDCSEVVDREAALDKLEAEGRLFSFSGGRTQDKREITDEPQVLSRVLKNVLTKKRLGAKPLQIQEAFH